MNLKQSIWGCDKNCTCNPWGIFWSVTTSLPKFRWIYALYSAWFTHDCIYNIYIYIYQHYLVHIYSHLVYLWVSISTIWFISTPIMPYLCEFMSALYNIGFTYILYIWVSICLVHIHAHIVYLSFSLPGSHPHPYVYLKVSLCLVHIHIHIIYLNGSLCLVHSHIHIVYLNGSLCLVHRHIHMVYMKVSSLLLHTSYVYWIILNTTAVY